MERISLDIQGASLDFSLARCLGDCIARRDNEEATLVCWFDGLRNTHSPQCLQCERQGEPGWETYGKNHGGRLRIAFNSESVVLIYS